MKKVLILMACLILAPVAWADQPAPPVPVPGGDNSNALPPPVDINSTTPVGLPSLPDENQKAQPTATPIPVPPKAQAPTDTPVPRAQAPTNTPVPEAATKATPTPEPAVPVTEEKTEEKPSGAPVSAGALSDYFPTTEGAQWTYEYLRPSEGQTVKGTFTIKCASAKQMANGTVRTVLETTENGGKVEEHYSLYGNMVQHMATGSQAITGDFVFKLPGAAGTASWTVTEKDGTLHKSKASLGQAQVYQKTYPDCVIVTEKVVKGGKPENTVIYYYAKGTGLVAVEVYSPSKKLIQTKSFALTSGPGN